MFIPRQSGEFYLAGPKVFSSEFAWPIRHRRNVPVGKGGVFARNSSDHVVLED